MCSPSKVMMSSKLADAKQECSMNPTCYMFVDGCGQDEFLSCTNTTSIGASWCDNILYIKGNASS